MKQPGFKRHLAITIAALVTLLGGCNMPTVTPVNATSPVVTTSPVIPTAPIDAEATTANGKVYYVAPDGVDTNPGTEDKPWRSIQKAADTLVAGDTVYIQAGTFEEQIIPKNSGSAGNPITYAANPGDTVTIDGANLNLPRWEGLFNLYMVEYIHVSGLRVINAGPTLNNPGIQVEDAKHILIQNNYVYNTSDAGILVWDSHDVIIEHNEVEAACYNGYNESISIGESDGFEVRYNHVHHSQKEGIDAKDGSSNGKVYGNHVHDTGAVGIYIDSWDKHTFNIEVFGNLIHNVDDDGIAIASEEGGLLENVKVYNNIAYGNLVGLSMFDCCAASTPIKDIQIINNTFYNNGWDPWGGGILLENPDAQNVTIRNNICSGNYYFQIAVDPRIPAGNYTVDHNLIDGYQGTEGEIYGDDYIEGDPRFINHTGGDFHLRSDSPAIDQGSPTSAPSVDYDGRSRPYGTGFDIGAFEFSQLNELVFLPFQSYLGKGNW
jgi:parallel beta-helix repeat protein